MRKVICTGHKHSRCLQINCRHSMPHEPFYPATEKCTKWTECEVEKDRVIKVRCAYLKED